MLVIDEINSITPEQWARMSEAVVHIPPYIVAIDHGRNDALSMVVARMEACGMITVLDVCTDVEHPFVTATKIIVNQEQPLPKLKPKPYWCQYNKKKWR